MPRPEAEPSPLPVCEVEDCGDVIVIRPNQQRLDSRVEAEFGDELGQIIGEYGLRDYQFDFTNNTFLSSAGLRRIVDFTRTIRQIEGEVESSAHEISILVSGSNSRAKEVIELAGLEELFGWKLDEEE